MKKLISASILSLCLAGFVISVTAQNSKETGKAISSASKTQSSANLSSNTPSTLDTSAEAIAKNNEPTVSSQELLNVYRVGIGDILDIRLMKSANGGRSTLFTVVAGGVIDLPVAGGPIVVAGLTTDDIQTSIGAELKRRALDENAEVSVGVRQYVSHTVLVTGLVGSPGTRILRREAVPLYVILAESQVRSDAGSVVILRGGSAVQSLNLGDPKVLNITVASGDVVNVIARSPEYYYIGGRVGYPGQKSFQSGISLLQAILAAGGTTRQNDDTVEISREGAEGRLVTSRFSLKQIKAGNVGDPKLQAGDRIEVLH